MFLGTLAVLIFSVPAGVIIVICFKVLQSSALAVAVMLLWVLLTASIAIPLLKVVAKTLAGRRENLVLVAQGR